MNFITLSSLKIQLGITTSDFDDLLNSIVSSVNTFIPRYCDREFDRDNYKEIVDCKNGNFFLRNTPINKILSAGYGILSSFTIKNNLTSNISIEIKDDKLIYMDTLSLSTTEFSYSDYDTTYELADDMSSVIGADITISKINNRNILNLWNGYLQILPNETKSINSTAYISAIDNFNKNYYINSVAPHIIIYDGGYDTVPGDLSYVGNVLGASVYQNSSGKVFTSETIGNYSYTLGDVSYNNITTILHPSYINILNQYKNITI